MMQSRRLVLDDRGGQPALGLGDRAHLLLKRIHKIYQIQPALARSTKWNPSSKIPIFQRSSLSRTKGGRILHHPPDGTTKVFPWPSTTTTTNTGRNSPRRSCACARWKRS